MIIADLDGSLFNNHHRAHLIPGDKSAVINWSEFNKACANDLPISETIDFVKHQALTTGQAIVFVTSRGADSRKETAMQLFNHFGGFRDCELIMRPMNDSRSSVEYKSEVFNDLTKQYDEPFLVIDDQPEVIQMVADEFPTFNRLLVESFDCTVRPQKMNSS